METSLLIADKESLFLICSFLFRRLLNVSSQVRKLFLASSIIFFARWRMNSFCVVFYVLQHVNVIFLHTVKFSSIVACLKTSLLIVLFEFFYKKVVIMFGQ